MCIIIRKKIQTGGDKVIMIKINKTIKIFFAIIILLIFIFDFSKVYAIEDREITSLNTNKNQIFNEVEDERDPGLPEVTIDDAVNWVERKGSEIVMFLQKFAQPFTIIMFIINAIFALVGILGNKRDFGKGLTGMFICLITYSVILYAPEIMDAWLNWVRS